MSVLIGLANKPGRERRPSSDSSRKMPIIAGDSRLDSRRYIRGW